MKHVLNFIAGLAAIWAVYLTAQLYHGVMTDAFSGGIGMTIVFLQIWGLISAGVAILFGFIGRRMDRTKPRPSRRLYNICIAAGLLCGLLILATPFVFG